MKRPCYNKGYSPSLFRTQLRRIARKTDTNVIISLFNLLLVDVVEVSRLGQSSIIKCNLLLINWLKLKNRQIKIRDTYTLEIWWCKWILDCARLLNDWVNKEMFSLYDSHFKFLSLINLLKGEEEETNYI
jgi:hypothetical protein